MPSPDLSLYVLVDPQAAEGRDLAGIAAAAARGGATLIQYRDKTSPVREMIERARAIGAALAPLHVPLLINDRVDVALASGAAGVHLGQDDMTVADARRLLGPGRIIGLTIKRPADIEAAPFEAIDYVCIGGVFTTRHKENPDPPLGLGGLKQLAGEVRARAPRLPIGAIAGITPDNAASVIAAGVDGIAVIGAVTGAADPQAAAAALRARIAAALERT